MFLGGNSDAGIGNLEMEFHESVVLRLLATSISTSPFSVNLMALPARFKRTWRSRPGIANQVRGHIRAYVISQFKAFFMRSLRPESSWSHLRSRKD